jgi:hypothetical protein
VATIRANTADGGINGVDVSSANSGGASGSAWDALSGGTGVWTFSNAQSVKGGMSYNCLHSGATAPTLTWNQSPVLTSYYGRSYVYFTSFAASSHPIIKALPLSFSSLCWRIDITSTGQIRVRDSASTILVTSTPTITTGAWWRFEWKVVHGTGSTGQITLNVYSGDATTPLYTYTNTACSIDTETDHFQFGPSVTTPQVPSMYFDEIALDDTTYPGPANIINQAPTANAGPDQTVTQTQTVTLTGAASSDPDGTIASYAWSQTSGTAVTLSSASAVSPTFTAPIAPASLVFQLTVTDNQGTSSIDTVTITIGSGLLKYNTAQGGTNGTTVTAGNSGGGSGDAFNGVSNANGEWTFSNANSIRGGLAYKCVQAGSASTNLNWDIAALTDFYGRAYFYFTAMPSSSQVLLKGQNAGFASETWRVDLTNTGALRIRDSAGTLLTTSTQTLVTGAFYRFEWHVIAGTGVAGSIELRVYAADAPAPYYSYNNDACNTNTETSHVFFGPSISTGSLPTFYLDELALSTTDWIGVSPGTTVNAAPVASAGPDVTVVQGSVVTLDGTGSIDSDGTIASYAWSQTSGTTVTLAGATTAQPTFTAPAGPAVLSFQLVVTDNRGATGTDSITLTIKSSLYKVNTAEGGSDGIVVTKANSGGASGNAWDSVNATNSEWKYSATNPVRGTIGYSCSQVSSGTSLAWDFAAFTEIYVRAYYYFTGFPTSSQAIIKTLISDYSAQCWRIDVMSTGQVRIRDGALATLATSGVILSPGIFYRFEVHSIAGTGTTGTIELRVYTADQTTPRYSYINTACNTNTELSHIQFGAILGGSLIPTVFLDDIAVDQTGWIGTAPGTLLNSPPTANAGPDQNISVNGAVTLNGSASSDLDGSIASYAWMQTSGTIVSLSSASATQPTFTAPASASVLVFSLTVTDNAGAIGMDSVTINVLAATILQNTAEGGTPGTAITVANSGGASGNPFTGVTGGTNTWKYASAHTVRNALSLQCDQITGSSAALMWTMSALTQHYGRMYFYISAYPSVSQPIVKGFGTGYTAAWRIDLNSVGAFSVRNSANTRIFTSTQAASPGLWHRLEWHMTSGTSTGNIEVRLYVGDQTIPLETYTVSNQAFNSETSYVQFGPSIGLTPPAFTNWYDELTIGTAGGGWIGIAPGTPINQPPTANAGPDISVEPGAICTLQGSGVDDTGIGSYLWTQLSGPAVALSSLIDSRPTFTVPKIQGGTTLVFGLVVTDDGGLSSPQDTVTITALTPTFYYARSGSWQP